MMQALSAVIRYPWGLGAVFSPNSSKGSSTSILKRRWTFLPPIPVGIDGGFGASLALPLGLHAKLHQSLGRVVLDLLNNISKGSYIDPVDYITLLYC